MIAANANIGGQGFGDYHDAMQQAVFNGDASGLEDVAGRSGSDAEPMRSLVKTSVS